MGSASPKRILVTGGTGLMGMGIRHMVETTEKRDDEVWFFLSPEETNLTWVSIVVMFENVAMIETKLCLAATTFKCIFVNVLIKYICLYPLKSSWHKVSVGMAMALLQVDDKSSPGPVLLKIKSCHDDNFVVTVCPVGCHNRPRNRPPVTQVSD